jgi:hypothetical protein
MLPRFFLAFAALAIAGCGARVSTEPKLPPRAVEPQSEALPRDREPQPKLLAPPPAYGNKVVMAKGPVTTHTD